MWWRERSPVHGLDMKERKRTVGALLDGRRADAKRDQPLQCLNESFFTAESQVAFPRGYCLSDNVRMETHRGDPQPTDLSTHLIHHHAAMPSIHNCLGDASAQGRGLHEPAVRRVLHIARLPDDDLLSGNARGADREHGRVAPAEKCVAVFVPGTGRLCRGSFDVSGV